MADTPEQTSEKKANNSALKARVETLEATLNQVVWLHAELAQKHGELLKLITQAAAQQMAAQLQPQVNEAIQQRLQEQLAGALTNGNAGLANLLT
ncbi:hypothetical protein ACEWX3_07670 [Mycobacterium sp. G7A2]|uniref:hypothetical protein n=1 Tax=Mycobacterium sp. G7A2 TaxID=3317307 RepID=UPI0035A8C7A0